MDNATSLDDTIDTHLDGYCEPDRERRVELLTEAWTPAGRLVDPPLEGSGIDAIVELVDAVLVHYPQHRFVRTTEIDAHHGFARYGWALVDPEGTAAVTGTDIAEFGADGKLVSVIGFFGDLTPVERADPR
jgi:hypothetical protein